MNKYTYIVFEDSGLDISKLIKENNPKTRIIHLYHGNYISRSKADEIIELKTDFEGLIENSYAWYEVIKDEKNIRKQIDNVLNNTKNIIMIDEIVEEIYPLELYITKKALEKNINCINIFFEPFYFLGKRRAKCYTEFFDEIIKIKNNNYCISCNYVRNQLSKDCPIPNMLELVNKIAYNVSINLNENTNTIVDKIMSEENPEENNKSVKKYKYVQVSYNDDFSGSFYSYKTTIDDIEVGDIVLVDRNGHEAYGTVESIDYYTKEKVPYPLEKTKDIIKVVESFEEYEEEDIKYCPKCHSQLIPIIYGLPTHEMFLKQEKGELILGGCVISPNDPKYYCKKCKKNITS
jgi:hypothetical protein